VKVVSAWNDNGYSLREGLRCAVLRGEYFMSLGWLTTRAVYRQVPAWRERVLVKYWPNTGQILVKYWSNTRSRQVSAWRESGVNQV
jgi:hypothetical protein